MTLIAVYNSDGCVGRCDARCYEAVEPSCDCICGGRNHGAGLQQASDNTHELAEAWIEEYAKKNELGESPFWEVLKVAREQMALF